MSQNYYGSINYTELLKNLKEGKIKTHKTEKGVIYVNVNVFINDEPNQYGDIASISAPLKDEFKTEENRKKISKVFIGNLKKSESTITEVKAADFPDDDDLPF